MEYLKYINKCKTFLLTITIYNGKNNYIINCTLLINAISVIFLVLLVLGKNYRNKNNYGDLLFCSSFRNWEVLTKYNTPNSSYEERLWSWFDRIHKTCLTCLLHDFVSLIISVHFFVSLISHKFKPKYN